MLIYGFLAFIALMCIYAGCREMRNTKHSRDLSGSLKIYRNQLLAIALFFFLWVMTAFRGTEIGNDTRTYIDTFFWIGQFGVNPALYMEAGYQYFNLLIHRLTSANAHAFVIICATLPYGIIAYFIYKYSKNYLLSVCMVFCGLFSFYMNVMRQGMAVALGVLAWMQIKGKKRIIALLLMGAAILFHTSAIVLLPLLFYEYFPRKYIVAITIAALILLLFVLGIGNDMVKIFVPRYGNYIDSETVGNGLTALLVDLIFSLAEVFLVYYKNDTGTREINMGKSVFACKLFVSCIAIRLALVSRVNVFFDAIGVVEFPNLMIKSKLKNKRIFVYMYLFLRVSYFIAVLKLRPDWNHLYPYIWWGRL